MIKLNSLYQDQKGRFRDTWFYHQRNAEGCTISKTPELRERILLSIPSSSLLVT